MKLVSDSVNCRSKSAHATKPGRELVCIPYEVRIEGARLGRFENLRDAITSAQITKVEHPLSNVSVIDVSTGQIVIEI
jgi:hypothetical protein